MSCFTCCAEDVLSYTKYVSKEVDVFIIYCVYLKDHGDQCLAIAVLGQGGVYWKWAVDWSRNVWINRTKEVIKFN